MVELSSLRSATQRVLSAKAVFKSQTCGTDPFQGSNPRTSGPPPCSFSTAAHPTHEFLTCGRQFRDSVEDALEIRLPTYRIGRFISSAIQIPLYTNSTLAGSEVTQLVGQRFDPLIGATAQGYCGAHQKY